MRKAVKGVSGAGLERFIARARRAAGLRGQVNVLVAGSAEIRRLNRAFRRQDKPTDVLSFPAIIPGIAGDIAVSADIARASARALGHPVADELKVLILHGVLHLAGYDHERDSGQMRRREDRLRRSLGLPSTLIARSQAPRQARPR